MHALRPHARTLARWMLAWWVMVAGLAAWAPALARVGDNPWSQVCSSLSTNAASQAGSTAQTDLAVGGHHGLDCLLCCQATALPPTPSLSLPHPLPLGHVLRSIPAARLAALVSAPLPARGPPAQA